MASASGLRRSLRMWSVPVLLGASVALFGACGAPPAADDCAGDPSPEACRIARSGSAVDQGAASGPYYSSTIAPPELTANDMTTDWTQPVVFHVFYKSDGVTGRVGYHQLTEQIDQLNRAFSGSEKRSKHHPSYAKDYTSPDSHIRFSLFAVEYVESDDYFENCALANYQQEIKPRYALDPSRYLNVYVCHDTGNLGLSWLPYQPYRSFSTGEMVSPAEDDSMLGTILDWGLLPGSTYFGGRWSQGDILTHEVGHDYGLRHLYDGGCGASFEPLTDRIADTPRQIGNPGDACSKKGAHSCPGSPGDDIENYMGIYADACRSHFTPGQVTYMRAIIESYKPTLVKQLPVGCVSAVDSTDDSPDLLPCVGDVVTGKPPPSSTQKRPWCYTAPSSAPTRTWGWACCPAADGSPDGEGGCRLGTPDFGI